jgi:hypothetical protein
MAQCVDFTQYVSSGQVSTPKRVNQTPGGDIYATSVYMSNVGPSGLKNLELEPFNPSLKIYWPKDIGCRYLYECKSRNFMGLM